MRNLLQAHLLSMTTLRRALLRLLTHVTCHLYNSPVKLHLSVGEETGAQRGESDLPKATYHSS